MTARNPAAELSPTAALIRGTVAPEEQETLQESRRWRAMEAAITLGILLIVVLSVADSIAAADWVSGMPELRLTAVLALVVAVGLSRRSVHWLAALPAGLLLGAIFVLWQVLGMEQFDGQSWFWERFTDLRFRLADWFTQAFNDGITTDNVPFVFFIVAAIWLATFPTVLLVLRRRNPWPLLILLGIVLSINVSYLDGKQWDTNFAFFIAGAALLLMRTSLLSRMERWRRRGTPFPGFHQHQLPRGDDRGGGRPDADLAGRASARPGRAPDGVVERDHGAVRQSKPGAGAVVWRDRLEAGGADPQFRPQLHPAGRHQPRPGHRRPGGRDGAGAAARCDIRPLYDARLAAGRRGHDGAAAGRVVQRCRGQRLPGAPGRVRAAVGGAIAAGAVHVWDPHGDQPERDDRGDGPGPRDAGHRERRRGRAGGVGGGGADDRGAGGRRGGLLGGRDPARLGAGGVRAGGGRSAPEPGAGEPAGGAGRGGGAPG